MTGLQRFETLSARERAVIAIAVLLDGHDAVDMLSVDKLGKGILSRLAKDFAELSPDKRLPLLGTLLRQALEEIESNGDRVD